MGAGAPAEGEADLKDAAARYDALDAGRPCRSGLFEGSYVQAVRFPRDDDAATFVADAGRAVRLHVL
eukprot:6226568-Prymnesium_polylepis.1